MAVALIMLSLCASSALGALQISLPLTKMSSLTVDLGPDYTILKNMSAANDTNETESSVMIINSKDPEAGNATLIASAKSRSLDETSIDEIMLDIFMLAGAEEIMNKTVKSSHDQDVVIHNLRMTESTATPGQMMSLAFWSLDEMNSVALMSTLDLNATEKIVETLAAEP